MSHTHPRLARADGCSIKVGTTGTVGALMSREMESVKHVKQTCEIPSLKYQAAPLSVPCGATPKRLQPRKNQSNDGGSSSSGSSMIINNIDKGITCKVHESQKPRQTPRKNGNGSRTPMLTPDRAVADGLNKKEKPEKKGHSFFVEVVDLKCNNPMSARFKKLGFSKLSESIA